MHAATIETSARGLMTDPKIDAQIAMHEEILKCVEERVEELEKMILALAALAVAREAGGLASRSSTGTSASSSTATRRSERLDGWCVVVGAAFEARELKACQRKG